MKQEIAHVMNSQPAYAIDAVLPHAGRMLLLDELLDYGPDFTRTAVTIRKDSVLCDATGVPSWVGLEYMAQTVGVYSGIEDVQRGERPAIGLLLGSRSYRASVPVFAIGARLVITAKLELRDGNSLVVFSCDIEEEGVCRAVGDVKAYRPTDIDALRAGSTLD